MEKDFDELLDQYMDQEKLYHIEGRKGVEALCQLTRAIGYKDPQYFGQMTSKAAIGDLICFLEDNPGAIEALHNWIRDTASPEFKAALEEHVQPSDEQEWEEMEPLFPNGV
jgi:hypothetical protein